MMSLECGKKDKITYHLDVNGYALDAVYHQEDIENIFIPLLKHIQQIQKAKKQRIFVFLAGPAGCGKSTLGLVLESLAKDCDMSFQCVGLDGFHYHQEYLDENHLAHIKGHPSTFDVQLFEKKLIEALHGDCYWPVYSRILHNPVDDAICIHTDIVLVEGNYLLLNEDGWRQLQRYCSYSIFISCEKEMVKDRLIARKCRGGLSYEQACRHYELSDSQNVECILLKSNGENLRIFYDGQKYFRV